VAVDKDGGLLISEDASGTIWRITYSGTAAETR
jgi:glucose/arabinose dehydrogenase